MKPIISVIIPVYNVEKYLKACVNSVLNQSFQDFELILVDDGSTDNSGKMCDEFTDERIMVIHKENGGLSDARNKGTKSASGKYITWIDSDDTVDENFLKNLYYLVRKYNAEISICEFFFQKEGEKKNKFEIHEYDEALSGEEAIIRMLRGEIHGTSACGLLLSRDLASKHLFPFGKYHEDDLTTYHFLQEANTVAYTSDKLYNYLQRDGSIMHRPFGAIDIAELDAGDEVYNNCAELCNECADAAMIKRILNYCDVAFKHPNLKRDHYVVFKRIITLLDKEFLTIMKSIYISRSIKIKVIFFRIGLLNLVMRILGKQNA